MQQSLYFKACFDKVYGKTVKVLKLSFVNKFEQVCQVAGYKPKLYLPSIDLQIKSTQAEELWGIDWAS